MLKHDACSSFDSFWKVAQESAGDSLHKKLVVMVTSKEVVSWSAEGWEWAGDLVFAVYLFKTSEYHLFKTLITYIKKNPSQPSHVFSWHS